MTYWLKIAGALAAVWLLAATAIHFAHSAQPTAESVSAYLAKTDLATATGKRRADIIANTESMFNRLPMEERQRVQRGDKTHNFFQSLTPAEQEAFLDATLPSGFKQLMDSFNKMEPAKRRQVVENALNEMKKHEGEAPPPGRDDKLAQHVVDQGLRSFYKDADSNVKLDLAPLIEQMQKNLQSGGDHR